MAPDRFGGGDSPSARRRARRRQQLGLDPAPPRSPEQRPAARAPSPKPPVAATADEARPSPEPAPRQGRPWFEWRGWDSVVTYVVLAVMLAGVITGLHRLLAAGLLVIGASALAWAITHRPGRRRSTSGYGLLLDWLLEALPRPVYLVLCVAVIALGGIGLIAG